MTLAPERTVQTQLDELTDKVDRLTRLLEEERVGRDAMKELVAESAPIVRSAYEQAALTLHQRDIDVAELADLAMRLAEAAPDLNRALGAFKAATALVDEVGAITGQGFELLAESLDELDRRGYFTFARGGLEVVDRIVTSYDEDDIQALGDNVVLIFDTVKEMTQPEVMKMLKRSLVMVREEQDPKKLSMLGLFKEMRDPEVKLGIHRMLTLLRGMSSLEGATKNTTNDPTEKEE